MGRPDRLENLVLVCRFHRRAIDDGGFAITRAGGTVEVARPDGDPLVVPLQVRSGPTLRRDPVESPFAIEVDEIRLRRSPTCEPVTPRTQRVG